MFSFEKILKYQETEEDILTEEIVKEISELANTENSIGKGKTAEVFISKTNPHVCYKIMHENAEYQFRHSAYSEGEFLVKAENISRSSDVKIPKPYYSILAKNENGSEFEVLVMERLHAKSIKDILHNNLDVPENFNFKEFVSRIEKFFLKLHEQKIHHRDAHGGNIMIEDETSNPCIIDFGSATVAMLSSEDPYQQTNSQEKTIVFTPDDKNIQQELYINLRKYLFEKYGNIHNL